MTINKELEIRRLIREEINFHADEKNEKAKKALLEQAELLENFNKKYPERVGDLRKNSEVLIKIYTLILNL